MKFLGELRNVGVAEVAVIIEVLYMIIFFGRVVPRAALADAAALHLTAMR